MVDKVEGNESESEEKGGTAASSASTKTTVTHGAALENVKSLLQ